MLTKTRYNKNAENNAITLETNFSIPTIYNNFKRRRYAYGLVI